MPVNLHPVLSAVPMPRRGPWALAMGASVIGGGVRFRVWAPMAKTAAVVVDGGRALPMARGAGGTWETVSRKARDGSRYRYVVDGKSLPDPVSRSQPEGVHGPSAVVDPRFAWTDSRWKGLGLRGAVFYEAHVGTFTPEGTFDAAIGKIAHLKSLGTDMLELLPVAEFPGDRNWGYDGVFLYAPFSGYGGAAGLKRLVDACHKAGIGVCMDVVYNHLGPEGNRLHPYGSYFSGRYRTLWGEALNYDAPGSDPVRRYIIENALHWVTEYHIDALRLDAVNHIYDASALHILQELKGAVEAQARRLGRKVLVVAESISDDSRLIRPVEHGGKGMDGQWADDFHHAVHALLTGERGGYYQDFGMPEMVARALKHGFAFDGRYNAYWGRRFGTPAGDLPGERFVVCLQNHDQVGNRPLADRLTALVGVEAHKTAAALMLCAPQTPMLFMGEEWGELRPFHYFTDFGDTKLGRQVDRGRRAEFKRWGWTEDSPDPQDRRIFEESRLDWSAPRRAPHAGMLALYRELLRLRRSRPALSNGRLDLLTVRHGNGWLAYSRRAPGGRSMAVFCNFSKSEARPSLPGRWRPILSTRESRFGGPDPRPPSGVARIAPVTAIVCSALPA